MYDNRKIKMIYCARETLLCKAKGDNLMFKEDNCSKNISLSFIPYLALLLNNVSTKLEMVSNARQNGEKAHNIKHCKCL